MRRLPWLVPLLVLLGPAGGAVAQGRGASSTDAAPVTDPLCWRGRPLPACQGFPIVEAQVGIPLASTSAAFAGPGLAEDVDTFEEPQLDWNLGYMVNVTRRWAVGGVFTLGTGAPDPLTGVRGRARYWLEERVSLELEAGAVRTDLDGRYTSRPAWGFTADARLNVGDRGSLFLRWDRVRPDLDPRDAPGGRGTQQALLAGVGAGSTWAVLGTGVGWLVLFALLSRADFQ